MFRLLNSLSPQLCNDKDNSDDESSIVLKKRPLLLSPKPDHHQLNWHLRRDAPIIIRYFCPKYLKLYIIHGGAEKECRLRGADSLSLVNANFVSSCDGIVLLSFTGDDYTRYGVFNPLRNERITIIDSPNLRKSEACGFFFHPLEKEYRILAVGEASNEAGYDYEYQIYSLGSQKWRRTQKNPHFNFRPGCCWKFEDANGKPAVAKRALHWYMEGKIMVFDMISEELSMKGLPFVDYLMKLYYFNGYLVTRGEELCFCVVGCREPAMEVWVLQHYEKWSWSRRYIVDLSWDVRKYPLMEPCLTAFSLVRVVGFDGDAVVLFWRHRGLFVYDLGLRSVDRIWMKKLVMPPHLGQAYYDRYCGFAFLQRNSTLSSH